MFCSVAISWQLNAAPYLCGVHEPFPQPREKTVPVMPAGQCAQFHVCTSLIPKPMTVLYTVGVQIYSLTIMIHVYYIYMYRGHTILPPVYNISGDEDVTYTVYIYMSHYPATTH